MSMNLGLHNIQVNTTSLADGHSLAAYLTSAAGTLITSTTVGAKEHMDALDASSHVDGTAYVASSDYLTSMGVVDNAGNWVPFTLNASGELPVSATVNFSGDYAEDSAHVSGDTGLFSLAVRRDVRTSGTSADGDYASFNVNANGELYVRDTEVFSALADIGTFLENIQDELYDQGTTLDNTLTELTDQGTTLDSILTELLDQGTTLDSILADTATIDSQTLSIQNTLTALSKAEDAPHASGDQGIQALAVRKNASGTNTSTDGDYSSLLTWSEGSLKTVDIANASILQQQVDVTNVAAQVPAANLANRRSLMLQNTGANKLWVGSATVTTSGATAGIEMPPNSFMELECGPAVNVYAVKVGATANTMNVLEMA